MSDSYLVVPTAPPKMVVGADGAFFAVGDRVRHTSDDTAIDEGKKPGAPGTVERLSLRQKPGFAAEEWAFVRWPVWKNPDPDGWPKQTGGGAVEDRARFFRKLSKEEQVAEALL